MGKRNRAALLPTQLPQLQNLIKRDPKSYEAEFLQQFRHFQSMLSIFCLKPDEEASELSELVTFVSQVSQCYAEETKEFPQQIMDLLKEHCLLLHPEVRRSLVQALILLRNKNIIDNTTDKTLREQLYTHIVTDIKNTNAKSKNNKLNKTLQSFMFTMLESAKTGNKDENAIAAKKSVDICIELYHKNIWNDAKTVNVIADACFSPIPKIAVTAVKFFLDTNENREEEESDDESTPDLRKMQKAHTHSKKTKAKARKMDSVKKKLKQKSQKKNKAEAFNFAALHLINDPQGFAERLFSRVSSKDDKWEVRILKLNLVSRMIGVHQLTLLGFYPLLIKYLQPSQRDVTLVLVCAAQASHSLVPPDDLERLLKAVANNFVTDRVSNEVMAVGINGIREICARQPLAMDATLLQDLTEYKNHRDKGVMMAARSLIGLFRDVNPDLLKKKDRGKLASARLRSGDQQQLQFGEAGTLGVNGFMDLDLLETKDGDELAEEDDGWEGWEVDEDDSDSDSDGWVDVPQDDNDNEYVQIAMSDDEKEDEKDKDAAATSEGPTEKKRRIGKRQLRKLQEEAGEEVLTEEQKKQISEAAAARRAEDAKKQEAMMKIATTRILTPADFARLEELRESKQTEILTGKKKKKQPDEEQLADGEISQETILGPRKRAKRNYEERMASVMEGREGRKKYGSRKGTKERTSSTNREKLKNKNFMMVIHKVRKTKR